ncbi:hypothetical protein, conserved, partial [Eimeria tenella]
LQQLRLVLSFPLRAPRPRPLARSKEARRQAAAAAAAAAAAGEAGRARQGGGPGNAGGVLLGRSAGVVCCFASAAAPGAAAGGAAALQREVPPPRLCAANAVSRVCHCGLLPLPLQIRPQAAGAAAAAGGGGRRTAAPAAAGTARKSVASSSSTQQQQQQQQQQQEGVGCVLRRHQWQWVVLLPFIDKKRLLAAAQQLEGNLLPEEQQRNSLSETEVYVHLTHPLAAAIQQLLPAQGRGLRPGEEPDWAAAAAARRVPRGVWGPGVLLPTSCSSGLAGRLFYSEAAAAAAPGKSSVRGLTWTNMT